jgi:hypothetical protein
MNSNISVIKRDFILFQDLIYLKKQKQVCSTYLLDSLNNIMERYPKNNCDHCWVNDYIDLTPERSMKICYCTKCEATFN